jgi:hypothetical protein
MPTWLVYGFRWPRAQVRIHIILQNLDDAAPEWLMAPATSTCLIEDFTRQWPETVARLPNLRFIEQYDPEDLTTKDQPYAYVCDQVREIRLGLDIDEVREEGAKGEQSDAIAELRDKIAPGEKLGWFVVVNGDVERWAPPLEDDDGDEAADTKTLSATSPESSVWRGSETSGQEPARPSTSRSIKQWFGGKLRSSKRQVRGAFPPSDDTDLLSVKNLKSEMAVRGASSPAPPLPPMSPSTAFNEKPSLRAAH